MSIPQPILVESPALVPANDSEIAPVTTRVTVAEGDGIGPEIMAATLEVVLAAGARLEIDTISVGEAVYRRGLTSGIDDDAWATIRRNRWLLKGPITTPQGGGYKSLNVTIRKTLGLYANVRPVRSYDPIVPSRVGPLDLVIIRENEEDLYAGIEYQQTPDVTLALKLITRSGSERINRFAFDYARATRRQRVTCMTKDNILKLTDGLFHRVFDATAADYPEIEADHWIIDIGMAKLAATPGIFDVVVMPNLYGDIASDVVAQVAGSVGLAGSANIGDNYAMFEAIHGSAPRYSGADIANPSGLLQAALMLLNHIGQSAVATRVEDAWLTTLEDGIVTEDLARLARAAGQTDVRAVGTRAFARSIIDRLGQEPVRLVPARRPAAGSSLATPTHPSASALAAEPVLTLRGVDVFVHDEQRAPAALAERLLAASSDDLRLVMISNRGQIVYPASVVETALTDQCRCRFEATGLLELAQIRALLERLEAGGTRWIKLENLYDLNGQRAYSLGQGQ